MFVFWIFFKELIFIAFPWPFLVRYLLYLPWGQREYTIDRWIRKSSFICGLKVKRSITSPTKKDPSCFIIYLYFNIFSSKSSTLSFLSYESICSVYCFFRVSSIFSLDLHGLRSYVLKISRVSLLTISLPQILNSSL